MCLKPRRRHNSLVSYRLWWCGACDVSRETQKKPPTGTNLHEIPQLPPSPPPSPPSSLHTDPFWALCHPNQFHMQCQARTWKWMEDTLFKGEKKLHTKTLTPEYLISWTPTSPHLREILDKPAMCLKTRRGAVASVQSSQINLITRWIAIKEAQSRGLFAPCSTNWQSDWESQCSTIFLNMTKVGVNPDPQQTGGQIDGGEHRVGVLAVLGVRRARAASSTSACLTELSNGFNKVCFLAHSGSSPNHLSTGSPRLEMASVGPRGWARSPGSQARYG